jgi:hypothetical protein
MPEFCTCGAELPPDARFCHKCGKPQRDEPVAAALAEQATVPAAPPVAAPIVPLVPLGFRNPVALRVGLLAAALLCLTMMIPGVNYVFFVWWLGAGYFSVWIYKRRTGQRLTVRGGAHMGWITGVLSCVLLSLIFAFFMAALQRVGGLAAVKDQLRDFAIDQKTIDEAIKRLQNPVEVLQSLAGMFLMMTLFCVAGGALGAKILSKD